MGREVFELARQIDKARKTWEGYIFIDDNDKVELDNYQSVICFKELREKYGGKDIEIVVAVGEPRIRRLLRERLQSEGYQMPVLVHPSANVATTSELGAGSIVCYNSFVSCGTAVGENVLIQPLAVVGHDSRIGNDSVISSFASIGGGCSIGDETFIGMSVPVKEKSRIGCRTIIGIGSAVFKDVPDNVIVLGNPARVLKENTDRKVFK